MLDRVAPSCSRWASCGTSLPGRLHTIDDHYWSLCDDVLSECIRLLAISVEIYGSVSRLYWTLAIAWRRHAWW